MSAKLKIAGIRIFSFFYKKILYSRRVCIKHDDVNEKKRTILLFFFTTKMGDDSVDSRLHSRMYERKAL